LRASFDYRPNAMHLIRFGGDYLFHNFRPEQSYMDTWYKDSVVSQKTNTVFSNSLIRGHEASAFFEDEMRLTDHLRANIGARYTLFHVQKETYQSIQPRISARYLILRNLSVKVSYSKMNQYIHLLSNSYVSQPTDIWVPVTDRIGPMNSHQFTGGLYYRWKTIDFSAEAYYKRLNNLVDYKDNGLAISSFSGWEDRVGLGRGRAYGMELMAKKNSGRLSGWLAYTLSWSDRWFPDGSVNKGRRFPAKYDNRHKIDMVATYKLSSKVELTSAWMYASGNHITIMDQMYNAAVSQSDNSYYGSIYNPYGYSASSRNNYQLPPYHRLDLGANFYKYRKKGQISIWNVSVCNVYMRPNPFMVSPVYYSVNGKRYVRLQETILFRCFPSVSYTYKF
ncbi:MAG: TonB-dependent receptor, partial [Parabacteroides sp.]